MVRYSEYPGVKMRGVLRKMVDGVDTSKLSVTAAPHVATHIPEAALATKDITQAWLWPRLGSFLRDDDVVITETGTANFGIWSTRFPRGVTAMNQTLWGSIGWSFPACQGAALAVKDMESTRRVILFVGDGSIQLTAQELSTMLRHGLKPIM